MLHKLVLFALFVFPSASIALADTAALAFDLSSPITSSGGGFSLGYEFKLDNTITMKSLGYYAETGAFLSPHEVGVYNLSGTLLASTTVTNAGILSDGFIYQSISPLVLGPGNYVITATIGNDSYAYYPTAFTTAPGVTYVIDRYVSSGNMLEFPMDSTGDLGWFGPNFQFVNGSTAVPEPSSAFALGLGIVACLRLRRAGRKA